MNATLLITLGVAALAGLAMAAKNKVDDYVDGLRFSISTAGFNLQTLGIDVVVELFNPAPVDVPVTALSGTILYKGEKIATFNSANSIVVKPGDNTINVQVQPAYGTLATNLVNIGSMISDPDLLVNYSITSGYATFTSSYKPI